MFIQKIKNTIKKNNLIQKNDSVLVAVSGGPDSVALLYGLCALRKELKFELCVAHLDHGLRQDSVKDREFVLNLAKKLKIPAVIGRVDIGKFSGTGSLEEIARNERQKFLFRVAKRCRANKIAIGHTRDDQAETVLMRIIRGTGLYGLNAILPKRKISGFTVIRPLIEVSRRQIESYLKKKKIKARLDKSNLEDIYFRNKIRNILLPLLEKEFNPNIKGALANLAETAAADYDYLFKKAGCLNPKPKAQNPKLIKFDLGKLGRLHPAMLRMALRLAYARMKGDLRKLTFQHLKEIEDLIFNRPVNSIIDLPAGVSVIKRKKFTLFYKRQT
ncbi:MAG: tRNA lysidine(34) synthetase TilS [Candidatus Omnitrophica bacterium]|nr:tRNA lysidine(34) synthetase TilS [Candidatus Omnitrophota bacterium]